MSRVAIIAAMKDELEPLVRGWEHQSRNGVDLWGKSNGSNQWIAACAGAGVEAAGRAFAEIEQGGTIDRVHSIGWAGALREEFTPGRVYSVTGIIDARDGRRWGVEDGRAECWLVTVDRVADQREKLRLAAAYGAGLVDMEAAAVAHLARTRNIPFHCLKGISDGVADRLPDFNRFITTHGKFQRSRFLLSALLRPQHWRSLVRLGKNSRRAARGLADSLLDVLMHAHPNGDRD